MLEIGLRLQNIKNCSTSNSEHNWEDIYMYLVKES